MHVAPKICVKIHQAIVFAKNKRLILFWNAPNDAINKISCLTFNRSG